MGSNVILSLIIIYFSVANIEASGKKNAFVGFANKLDSKKTFNRSTSSLSNSISRDECNLPDELTEEISRYKPIVEGIINASVNGIFKKRTWRTLARFVDKFGSRIAGSDNLENSIDYMVDLLKKNQLENVHTEPALVPKWVRGRESCWLVSPRLEKLSILGLGSSIGTPAKGITAHAVVVESFEELKKLGKVVEGKIVVFNEPFISYEKTVKYRGYGAIEAAKLGAVATLIRSVTPFSIDSPHTGWQHYQENVTQIPTAAITIEIAETLQRMYQAGDDILIYLYMEARNLPPVMSRNTIGDITGHQHPEKVVVVSGHLDSWDVGQGAMDDGGGAFISWNALALLKVLGLRPRRTLRSILWTAEEEGLVGAAAYFHDHRNNTAAFDFVMESDEGTFQPLGLSFSGSSEAGCILKEILKLMHPLNATQFASPMDGGPDIEFFTNVGIPGAALLNANERYFWYHHSNGDRMTVEDPTNLDMCTALWAASAFVVADLSIDMPR